MPRPATTSDVVNDIDEPRRRPLLELWVPPRAQAVRALVVAAGLPPPALSKHLGVLRKVGVVSVDKNGRQHMYRLNPQELKSVYDWAKAFEHFWSHQLDRIKQRAEEKAH